MHVFQTAGVPPRSGRTIFPTIGWTRNSRVALTKSVRPKRVGTARLRAAGQAVARNDTPVSRTGEEMRGRRSAAEGVPYSSGGAARLFVRVPVFDQVHELLAGIRNRDRRGRRGGRSPRRLSAPVAAPADGGRLGVRPRPV